MKSLIDGDKYYVTMCGKVFVKERKDIVSNRHPTPYTRAYKEKQLKTVINKLGYEQVGLTINGCRKLVLVHRLVAQQFIPNPENLPEVNHKDGVKSNNVVSNLEWCSRSSNALHASEFLGMRGENIGTHKLTKDDVYLIHELLKLGFTQTELGEIFKVTNHAIYRIEHGYNWAWLTGRGRKVG